MPSSLLCDFPEAQLAGFFNMRASSLGWINADFILFRLQYQFMLITEDSPPPGINDIICLLIQRHRYVIWSYFKGYQNFIEHSNNIHNELVQELLDEAEGINDTKK